jgi:hypothetical protein
VCIDSARTVAISSRREYERRVFSRVLLAACALCALHCGSTGNDVQVASRAPADHAANDQPQPAKPKRIPELVRGDDLESMHAATFLPLVPKSFEGFRAKADAEGKDIDLGEGAGFAVLKRSYAKGGTWLEIEVVDAQGAKPLRALFAKTRELERDTQVAVIKPMKVQGHQAIAQWNETARAARVSVLVEDRYLVNLHVRPADGIANAVSLAEKVELSKLASGGELAKH